MTADPVAAAHRLLAVGRTGEAVALIGQAAARGDSAAAFQQALWWLAGVPLKRDLAKARVALRAAAARGHGEGRLLEAALLANGSGAPADWPQARRRLEEAAATDPNARALIALLDTMPLQPDGMPLNRFAIEDLVPDGAVRRVRALLTPAECAHVAHAATDLLAPALVSDPGTGRLVPHPIRTSDAAQIGPVREDPAIRALNHRIAAISGTETDQGEALTVLRYAPGQQYRLHLDTLPGVRNQRVATVLIYLNQGYGGGETVFPDHDVTVTSRIGDAIVFRNTLADGSADPRSRHAGLPVTLGTKWIATRWIRARPFSVWSGPESV